MHGCYCYILCVYIYLVAITQWMCWVSLKYWYSYHTLKLLCSPSRSNVLIVVHIINNAYRTGFVVKGISGSHANIRVQM